MSTIKIFQNYITDADLKELDPDFIPNDWRQNPTPEYREIAIFFDIFDKGRYKEADYVGVFSKKFNQKAKMSGKKWIDFIKSNPGYDVYFINPFPQNVYFSYNVWDHGEMCHPGIIDATQQLFDYAKLPVDIAALGRNNHQTLLYCNYWVGSHRFWEAYIAFLKKLFNVIHDEMPLDVRQLFFNPTPHDNGECHLFPFVFERLFSTYLLMHPNVKSIFYPHNAIEVNTACVNEGERAVFSAFHDEIDLADREGQSCKEQINRAREVLFARKG